MGKVTIQGFLCERCKHIWAPRTKTDEDPVICPKCKSPYWNRPKVTQERRRAIIKHFSTEVDKK